MNKIPTENHIKEVEQDDRIIQFDAGEKVKLRQSIGLPDLDEESKRSDRFFGMRLNGKSIDDIENTFLPMFAEFIVLMALFIGMLGFGILLWAIFGG